MQEPTSSDILKWAVETFGPCALDRHERARRVVEEAVEVAQAQGVDPAELHLIVERASSRPTGEIEQEIGGLIVTLEALAANIGVDLGAAKLREWTRVTSRPREWWQRKHGEKVVAGTAAGNPPDFRSDSLSDLSPGAYLDAASLGEAMAKIARLTRPEE